MTWKCTLPTEALREVNFSQFGHNIENTTLKRFGPTFNVNFFQFLRDIGISQQQYADAGLVAETNLTIPFLNRNLAGSVRSCFSIPACSRSNISLEIGKNSTDFSNGMTFPRHDDEDYYQDTANKSELEILTEECVSVSNVREYDGYHFKKTLQAQNRFRREIQNENIQKNIRASRAFSDGLLVCDACSLLPGDGEDLDASTFVTVDDESYVPIAAKSHKILMKSELRSVTLDGDSTSHTPALVFKTASFMDVCRACYTTIYVLKNVMFSTQMGDVKVRSALEVDDDADIFSIISPRTFHRCLRSICDEIIPVLCTFWEINSSKVEKIFHKIANGILFYFVPPNIIPLTFLLRDSVKNENVDLTYSDYCDVLRFMRKDTLWASGKLQPDSVDFEQFIHELSSPAPPTRKKYILQHFTAESTSQTARTIGDTCWLRFFTFFCHVFQDMVEDADEHLRRQYMHRFFQLLQGTGHVNFQTRRVVCCRKLSGAPRVCTEPLFDEKFSSSKVKIDVSNNFYLNKVTKQRKFLSQLHHIVSMLEESGD